MSTLKRLQKLAAVSKSLRKDASVASSIGKGVLAVGAPVVAGGLMMEAPGVASRKYKKNKEKFLPATHKAELGLE